MLTDEQYIELRSILDQLQVWMARNCDHSRAYMWDMSTKAELENGIRTVVSRTPAGFK